MLGIQKSWYDKETSKMYIKDYEENIYDITVQMTELLNQVEYYKKNNLPRMEDPTILDIGDNKILVVTNIDIKIIPDSNLDHANKFL